MVGFRSGAWEVAGDVALDPVVLFFRLSMEDGFHGCVFFGTSCREVLRRLEAALVILQTRLASNYNSITVKWVILCSVADYCYEWYCFHRSKMFEEWKGKKKMRKMLEELDRKIKESPEAYLEIIHREIDSLKHKLKDSKRRGPDVWEVNNYEREVAALKSKLYAWFVPIPLGPSRTLLMQ